MKTINIEDIAKEYERLLGHNFDVKINTNLDYTNNKIQTCVYPTRRPYKVKDINSEVIEIYIEIYLPVTYVAQKDAWLNHINKAINGLVEGEFDSNGDTWSYCSTLDFTRPLMSPMVDSGQFMQLVSLQGQMLVSASDGAMLLNDVNYVLSVDEVEENGTITTTSGELKLLETNTNSTNEPESTLMCNEVFAGAYNRTQSSVLNLSCLVMNDRISRRFVQAIERIKPFEKNQIFNLSKVYKKWKLATNQKYILTDVTISGRAGAFSILTMSFMHASSVLEEDSE